MRTSTLVSCSLILVPCLMALPGRAEDPMLLRAKTQLLVEQAGELLADANRKGSATHSAPYQYYFGLMYGSGTNLMARADSPETARLMRKYMELIQKNYEAYTKVETAASKAAATGSDRVSVGRHVVHNGSRHRAKRMANAEKLGAKELATAIEQWEKFAVQLKKKR